MSLLSAFDVRLCRTALIGIALTACAGSSEEHTPGVNYDRYGISWTGIVGSPTSDTLTVKACWNDECPTLTLPITGLAPASAFVQAQPDPPEGAPASVQGGTPGEDGSCWGRMEWVDDIGVYACAMTTSPGASEVELTVFLDLIVKKTSLREGDDAVLQVTDGANGTTLVDSVRTIDADAPYYVEFDFGD